jgi:hypothetical protein
VTLTDLRPRHLVHAEDRDLTDALAACLQVQRSLTAELRARQQRGEMDLTHLTGAHQCTRKDMTVLG